MRKELIVPFKTPLDYFLVALDGNAANINKYPEIQKTLGWDKEDNDLHIYPHTDAKSAILSMGCSNKCKFCPTALHFKGKVVYGDPETIIPNYANQSVHFMDEDFFNNDMDTILPLLKRYNVTWLAMSTYNNFKKVIAKYGEDYLYDCGCVCVEMGLENVALMMKCDRDLWTEKIAMYFLNMSFLPGETKESVKENSKWMKDRSLRHPIHFNNGVWYAPGQFYYPYESIEGGEWTNSELGRVRPSWIPNTFLDQNFVVDNLELTNYFTQVVFGIKEYQVPKEGNIREFIDGDYKKAAWLITGIRCGGII